MSDSLLSTLTITPNTSTMSKDESKSNPKKALQKKLQDTVKNMEESGFDRNNNMMVFDTKKRHDELEAMAPEQWLSFHKVNEKRSLYMHCQEQLYWMKQKNDRKEDSDFSLKRQKVVLDTIKTIVKNWNPERVSETEKLINGYLNNIQKV